MRQRERDTYIAEGFDREREREKAARERESAREGERERERARARSSARVLERDRERGGRLTVAPYSQSHFWRSSLLTDIGTAATIVKRRAVTSAIVLARALTSSRVGGGPVASSKNAK